jgi:hypothetical protein
MQHLFLPALSPTSSTLSFNGYDNSDRYILSNSSMPYNYQPFNANYSYQPLNNKYIVSNGSPIPFVPVGTSYIIPSSLPSYLDLNKDQRVHERMTKFFYYKVIDDWLYDSMVDVLKHLKFDNDKQVSKTSKNDEDYTTKETQESVEAKIKFIETEILKKKDMYRILTKLVRESRLNWYDLPKIEYSVKEVMRIWLKKNMRK